MEVGTNYFSEEDARIIAKANKNTDEFLFKLPLEQKYPERHFNMDGTPYDPTPENNIDTRVEFAKACRQAAAFYWSEGYIEKALETLGQGLHAIQDMSAHGTWRPSDVDYLHPGWMDKPDENTQGASDIYRDTNTYYKDFFDEVEANQAQEYSDWNEYDWQEYYG